MGTTENRSENTEILSWIEKDYKSLQSDYTRTKQSLIDYATELIQTKGDFEAVSDDKLKDKIAHKLYEMSYEEYLWLTGDSKLKGLNPKEDDYTNTTTNNNVMNNTETTQTQEPKSEIDILREELNRLKSSQEKEAFEQAFSDVNFNSPEEKEQFDSEVKAKLELVNPNLEYKQKLELVKTMIWANSNSVNALRDINTLTNSIQPTAQAKANTSSTQEENTGLSDAAKRALGLI